MLGRGPEWGLIAVSTLASVLVVFSGDAWPLVGTCIALPLAAFAATIVADR